ncbi:universal stress protein [Zobellella sp. An-6]|uniref:universal stress protein n=1 Tax=Zobellella sp. An-6 TaxID=3400218 RepID=UPI004041B272
MNTPHSSPFRHLLVAVDGSQAALQALDTAAELAHAFHSRLSLVSVYRHFSYTNRRYTQLRVGPIEAASPVELSLKSLAEEALLQAQTSLTQRGLRADCHLRRGTPATVILELADQLSVDAIVLGSHAEGDRLFGSLADRVSAQAHCSCIRVRGVGSGT